MVIGNSRLKWAKSKAGELYSCAACSYDENNFIDSIKQAMKSVSQADEILLANVAGENLTSAFQEYALAAWSREVQIVKVTRQSAGVTNAYAEIEQLGIDRWLAAIAGWNRYKKAVCVIDCGTALTLDIVNDEGVYKGGYIIPGPALMIETLTKNTRQIEATKSSVSSLEPGRNTSECVENGALIATVYTIEKMLEELRQQASQDYQAVITGGAANEITVHLQGQVEYEPYLVLHGLNIVAGDEK